MSKNSTPKSKKKKAMKKAIMNRRGIFLILLLAVLILVLNIITASFSWFQPLTGTHNGMQYQETTGVRSENCTYVTYADYGDHLQQLSYHCRNDVLFQDKDHER